MTDKEYVNQLSAICQTLDMLDPLAIDHDTKREKLLEEIHDMNIAWKAGRRWRHWHYVVKLIFLFLILAYVIWCIVW